MKDSVYVESSVISYHAAKDSAHPLAAGRQQKTRQWWERAVRELTMYSSDLVREEVARGDSAEVERRVALLTDVPELATSAEAEELASRLLVAHAIPREAADDALHIAIAATNGLQFLVSWNFKHILNATKQASINTVIRDYGYSPPTLCTPEQFGFGE